MSNQFTAGPWLTKESMIYSEASGQTLAVVYDLKHDADSSEEEGNAVLIAAAPDLYAAVADALGALRTLRNVYPQEWDTIVTPRLTNTWDQLRAALALVDGGKETN